MAKKKLKRIIRRSTSAEKRRHNQIRAKTDEEFASRRKEISASRAILAKLRSQRELKGFSLADVAKRTGMARSNLCRLEQNGDNVKLDTLQRYATALDCELVVELRQTGTKTKKQRKGADGG
ncbi:MAG: helix-turn-helix transcriptional regulator [Planctomycetes bacterium]|nr:helix-turn-helix transcriptional regulator [Planctomycetota bacterium]MBL7040437.1 helix-turn-helix transcriptional regulator [Pirellulaceae bacterium]